MENTVAIMNATAEDMEAAIRAEEEAAERIESESEYKPQCNWDNPHNYKTVGNLDHARNLYTNPAPKKTRKKTSAAEQQQKWLSNAKVDENGKYQIMVDPDLDNRGDHKSWAPYAWIITNDCKRVRISWKFAKELAQSDKAIEINKEGLKDIKKAA